MQDNITSLAVGKLQPGKYQPRTYFDPDEMAQMVDSVKAQGIIQALLVRPIDDNMYEIVAGERRWRAATAAGLLEVPVMIREMTDEDAIEAALTENTQRSNMSPTEEAQQAAKLLRYYNNRGEVAKRLGMSPATLDSRLALMNCSENVQIALNTRKIQLGHAELLATTTKEKQDKVIERLLTLPILPTVAEFKAQLEQISKQLGSAIFDKTECAGCQYNSGNQQALFGESIKDGHCTNGQCFDAKTEAELESRAEKLRDNYPVVRIVRAGENFTVLKLVATGEMGVGEEQAKACRGCADFGAAVSNIPGKVGSVYESQCFNPTCNASKVAARIKAEKQPDPTPESTKTDGGKKPSASTPAQSTKPKVTVQDSKGVLEYRQKIHRRIMAKELLADASKSLTVLLALCINSKGRTINGTKLSGVYKKLATGDGDKSSISFDELIAGLHGQSEDIRSQLLTTLAASTESDIELRDVMEVLKFTNANIESHWRLNEEYLGILTKSEIEVVAEELGIKTHMGDKEFSKLMGKKKDEIVKGLLAVDGFEYQGKVPKVMRFNLN